MSNYENFDGRESWEEDISYDGAIVSDKAPTRGNRAQRLAPGMLFRTGSDQLINCRTCGRHFHKDRVEKHEGICRNSYNKKREPFDSFKQLFGHLKKNYVKHNVDNGKTQNKPPTAVVDLYDSRSRGHSTRTERRYCN